MTRLFVSIFSVIGLVISGSLLSAENTSSSCDPIQTILWPESDSCIFDEDCLMQKFVTVGESAIPILQKALDDNTGECAEDRHEAAIFLLSLIGGIQAVDTLQYQFNREPNSYAEAAICFAMASTGRKQDIEFLLKSLKAPDPDYDRWSAVEAAAISLGILRYKQALPIMKELIQEDPSGLLGSTLVQTIAWFEQPVKLKPSTAKQSDEQQIGRAILSCCPLSSSDGEDRYTSATISTDGIRASVEVMLGNEKYLYLLRKTKTWEVTGMGRVVIYD